MPPASSLLASGISAPGNDGSASTWASMEDQSMVVERQDEKDPRVIHCEWCKRMIPHQDGVLVLFGVDIALFERNRGVQAELTARQQFIQARKRRAQLESIMRRTFELAPARHHHQSLAARPRADPAEVGSAPIAPPRTAATRPGRP